MLEAKGYDVSELSYESVLGADTDIRHWRAKFAEHMDELLRTDHQDRRYDDEDVGFDDLFYNHSENRGETWAASDYRVDGSTPGSAWVDDPWVGRVGDTLHFVWTDGRSGSGDVLSHTLAVGTETEPISVPAESLDSG